MTEPTPISQEELQQIIQQQEGDQAARLQACLNEVFAIWNKHKITKSESLYLLKIMVGSELSNADKLQEVRFFDLLKKEVRRKRRDAHRMNLSQQKAS